jgi:hypothetical protein
LAAQGSPNTPRRNPQSHTAFLFAMSIGLLLQLVERLAKQAYLITLLASVRAFLTLRVILHFARFGIDEETVFEFPFIAFCAHGFDSFYKLFCF